MGDEIRYQELVPPLIANGTIDYAQFSLSMNGLKTDSVPSIDIDGRFLLIQPHPESHIFVCPILPNKQPTINEIWNINDYLSFSNDIPSIPIPENFSAKEYGFEYLYGGLGKKRIAYVINLDTNEREERIPQPIQKYELENRWFIESQLIILKEIQNIKLGPFTQLIFYVQSDKHVSVDLTKEFFPARDEIRFYAMALRQSDFLAELLIYYKIFESLSPKDHYGFLQHCIDRITKYNFGKVKIVSSLDDYDARTRNLFTLLRTKARKQLKELKALGINNIGEYLYKNERCPIVHGKTSKRVSSIKKEYFFSLRNAIILKLASRIGICMKLNGEI